MHTPLYRPARLPLCPAHFGVATNYIVSPKNRRPNNRLASVAQETNVDDGLKEAQLLKAMDHLNAVKFQREYYNPWR